MKGKIIKLITVMLLLVTLTTINFIYVGASFVSLAAEEISTNHKNIDFTSTLKSESLLTLSVTVKNEGYFNGEITLENSNFKLKNTSSEYVNKIEENKITLNQINAGTTASFDVEIEPVKEDIREYFKREVLPYAPDAWIDGKKTKIGYEIPFTRYFYKYVPPRPSEEIMSEILELEKSLDGSLEGIFN